MNRRDTAPIIHGGDHAPWGADPSKPGPWIFVGDTDAPPFVNGSNASPTEAIPNPVPMRFRMTIGRPNIVRSGEITDFIWHQIEIQGDVTGVASGDTVFVIPAAYRHEYDVPYHTHDDAGLYVPCRLFMTGEFVYDVP